MCYSLLLDAEKAYNEFMSEFQKGIYVDSERYLCGFRKPNDERYNRTMARS
jgi:hypothetical protein